MYSLYRKLFEFYAYRINRFIWLEYTDKWDSDIRENMEFFCKNFFNNENLNERTLELLENLKNKEVIPIHQIYFLVKNYHLIDSKSIREYVIYGKGKEHNHSLSIRNRK